MCLTELHKIAKEAGASSPHTLLLGDFVSYDTPFDIFGDSHAQKLLP